VLTSDLLQQVKLAERVACDDLRLGLTQAESAQDAVHPPEDRPRLSTRPDELSKRCYATIPSRIRRFQFRRPGHRPLPYRACPCIGAAGKHLACQRICGSGTADLMCRWVAPKLVPGFARTAITENRPGAACQIAVSYVKGRSADGKTILVTPTSMLTIYPHIYNKLAYDWRQDLTPVSLGCVFQYGLAVGSPRSARDQNSRRLPGLDS
jgi:hypothetical protein